MIAAISGHRTPPIRFGTLLKTHRGGEKEGRSQGGCDERKLHGLGVVDFVFGNVDCRFMAGDDSSNIVSTTPDPSLRPITIHQNNHCVGSHQYQK
mmetsp:Transcript_108/g.119  ORF Transcript_108/g.119 Transcript_108/m.119 type:complete len:95 (-) Transcript_108:385-669(-)